MADDKWLIVGGTFLKMNVGVFFQLSLDPELGNLINIDAEIQAISLGPYFFYFQSGNA